MEFGDAGDAAPRMDEVLIDLGPWKVRRFPYTARGADDLRRTMEELGFPGCSQGAPGWAEWPEALRHSCHGGAYLERFRRESMRAPRIEIPA